jgi:hypothetical protein
VAVAIIIKVLALGQGAFASFAGLSVQVVTAKTLIP